MAQKARIAARCRKNRAWNGAEQAMFRNCVNCRNKQQSKPDRECLCLTEQTPTNKLNNAQTLNNGKLNAESVLQLIQNILHGKRRAHCQRLSNTSI
jgi:hypothetical protein